MIEVGSKIIARNSRKTANYVLVIIVFRFIPGSSPRDTRITKRTHFLLLIVKSAEVTTNRLLDHSKATLAPTD